MMILLGSKNNEINKIELLFNLGENNSCNFEYYLIDFLIFPYKYADEDSELIIRKMKKHFKHNKQISKIIKSLI